jgi:PAS domain S-box-containing protein
LLGYSKNEVIGKNIGNLFANSTIDKSDFLSKYTGPGDNKIIGKRTKIKIKPKAGKEIEVLILLSKASVDKENSYTAFIQKIDE